MTPTRAHPGAVPAAPGAAAPPSRAGLVAALESHPTDAVLETALAALATGADLPLLLAAVKGLVRVGVPGLAVRLLRAAGAGGDLERLAGELETLPTGEVDRSGLETRWRANAAALAAADPPVAPPDASLLDRVCVYETSAGNRQLAWRAPSSGLGLVVPFADHAARAAGAALPEVAFGMSFLLGGVPAEPLWRRLAATRAEPGYRPPLDVVETDASVFGAWLALVDLAAPLADERLWLFVGPDAPDAYRRFLLEHPWRRPATVRLTNHRPGWSAPDLGEDFHRPVVETLHARLETALARQRRRYDGADAARWARRYEAAGAGGPPLRIAGLTTRYSTYIQHAMRDLAGAFRRRGCEFEVCVEPSASCGGLDPATILADGGFDLVVLINHLRAEAGAHVHPRLPCVSWIQDHMPALLTPEAGRTIGPFDLVLAQETGRMAAEFAYPPDHLLETSNLTCLDTYDATPLPEAELAPRRCDVSYVGHGSEPPAEHVDEIARGWPDPARRCLHAYAELVARRLERSSFLTFVDRLELLLEAERTTDGAALSPEGRRQMLPATMRVFDRALRHQTLAWAARWAHARGRRFRVHGRGWDRHPRLGVHAAGPVDNGRPLRAVYQASAVTLQMSGYHNLHQRLLDAVACGGFVLTRANPTDFLGPACRAVSAALGRRPAATLDDLRSAARDDAGLAAALDAIERSGALCLAPAGDERRRRQSALAEAVYGRTGDDDDVLGRLRSLASSTERRGGDLPGFDATTFDGPEALFALLDRHVDDAPGRGAIMTPMRESIVRHDTYDGLVDRVLARLRALFAGAPV
ncbi:MAG: glycosyltransferase family protein [Planctomycetota bacterium]|jgi:hypothetical protein